MGLLTHNKNTVGKHSSFVNDYIMHFCVFPQPPNFVGIKVVKTKFSFPIMTRTMLTVISDINVNNYHLTEQKGFVASENEERRMQVRE